MAKYRFELPLHQGVEEVELVNDDEAWAEAVTCLGQILKDVDGGLPGPGQWRLTVHEGPRQVIDIEISAKRY
jgi:hypothetical protein